MATAADSINNSTATIKETPVCTEFHLHPNKLAGWRNGLPLTEVVTIFKVLANETRTSILYLLAQKELCVCDLATILDSTVSNVSHHLRLLRVHKLVKYRRQGRMVFYSLDDEHVLALIEQTVAHVQHCS